MSSNELTSLFESVDQDNSGAIDFTEFLLLMKMMEERQGVFSGQSRIVSLAALDEVQLRCLVDILPVSKDQATQLSLEQLLAVVCDHLGLSPDDDLQRTLSCTTFESIVRRTREIVRELRATATETDLRKSTARDMMRNKSREYTSVKATRRKSSVLGPSQARGKSEVQKPGPRRLSQIIGPKAQHVHKTSVRAELDALSEAGSTSSSDSDEASDDQDSIGKCRRDSDHSGSQLQDQTANRRDSDLTARGSKESAATQRSSLHDTDDSSEYSLTGTVQAA